MTKNENKITADIESCSRARKLCLNCLRDNGKATPQKEQSGKQGIKEEKVGNRCNDVQKRFIFNADN